MQPHLNKGEAWMLRRINLHDLASSTFDILRDNWPPPEQAKLSTKGMPARYDEAAACASGLKEHGLVEGYGSDKGWHVKRITGPGRECLWEIDHPDIVEKMQDWARRSPVMACLIVAVLALGAIAGIASLVWNIWSYLHPAVPACPTAAKVTTLLSTWFHS